MVNPITLLNVSKYVRALQEADYNPEEIRFLKDGFTNGFDIGYRGPKIHQSRSKNITFTIGDKMDMWGKIMKEVKAKRFAGPYEAIPYENFIQSPTGLVPKAGNKTRLIFHLSYRFGDREEDMSLNEGTPRELCTVKYNDLYSAVQTCLEVSEEAARVLGTKIVFLGKTDLSSAFRYFHSRSYVFVGWS